ncbi:hypothetical protein BVC93_01585 [Mycobacterium sp. MS1601]|uniref:extracellular catalytic domain type 1 short-chain-length polyhydroxyalkanoate depolymerase n=1 Tax=Mycobacterium sp. MS1601 TaxID=1936029 RepID=UPI00097925F5|nr:PHB depolymerase family esterase [Mycobacterium sp. MS1601]AQA01336.1 hypothetical protein BVC93_01585 [Mycobacterium sp. MS1601]
MGTRDEDAVGQSRRRWPWIFSGIGAVLVMIVGALTAVAQYGLPWWHGDRDHNHEFDGLRYQVHLPPHFDGEAELPVIMAIHGCGMTGFGWNSMKSTTQFNDLADREGFIVVYPTQQMFRDKLNCWRSNDPRHQQRSSGEPLLLAGVARQVIEDYHADPRQVHVVGASSGAGTAVILAATYPEIFATATSVAGGEYGLNQVDPENPDATPPDYTARQAWAQMGEHARAVPLLVVQGDLDEAVPPLVATRLVEHWSAVHDLVDDGLLNNSRVWNDTVSTNEVPGGHRYTHTVYTHEGESASAIELFLVEGMGHAYSGPAAQGLFVDRAGPDTSALVWNFAKDHPLS